MIYNLFLHPLSNFPGPKLGAATRLWHIYHRVRGDWVYVIKSLHDIYGPVVRIAPDEVSFTESAAWLQIYGHRSGKPELQKDSVTYSNSSAGQGSILSANRERHSYLRKQLSYGFSERSLREQDVVIRGYANLCMQRLKERCDDPINMVEWFNVSHVCLL